MKLPPRPQSYSVTDVGKPGFPKLTRGEAGEVQAIRRYADSDTLRLAWVNHGNEFIVFDATEGPCSDFAPGYAVLNVKCPGHEYYQPGEDPYHGAAARRHPPPGCKHQTAHSASRACASRPRITTPRGASPPTRSPPK